MRLVKNAERRTNKVINGAPFPSTDVNKVSSLLKKCPIASETPLLELSDFLPQGNLWVKDERERMGLGSFKALGAAYVIASDAQGLTESPCSTTLEGKTYVTASAGNHGLSLAAGAKIFGAKAIVFISETVPETFSDRLREKGAIPVRKGSDYAASMSAALEAAKENDWILLSDSSWENYTDKPLKLMEGYLQMAEEAMKQCESKATHVFLQAGVGGLAGAVAAHIRKIWGDTPTITVVEPSAAPALQASIELGKPVLTEGPDSVMGRLDCKEPSFIALNGLARDADFFLTLDDDEVTICLEKMSNANLATTASGGAGVAAAMNNKVAKLLKMNSDAKTLCFLSEVAE
ncbi:MAG: pyridoxal-phosphate dependent enzyme [Rhodobacteraceae bacterium]|nr:pyridoxal-phosphate dependent enzyme [Paracoccaceae bacterium]